MRTIPFLLAIAIMLTAISSEAQWQDRLYPFRELTDEMVAQIDLKDGSIEDWLEVLGEPALTGLDFVGYPYDPSSYDCRLWLAWHEATDRLYIAAEIVDDIYVDIEKPSFWMFFLLVFCHTTLVSQLTRESGVAHAFERRRQLMKNGYFPALVLLMGLAIPAGTHTGDRVFPIPELTDEMLEEIRLDDGSVDEWYDLVGEPTMTLLDFQDPEGNRPPGPSELDFRIWLAWHDDPDRLYVAFVSSDDEYSNSHDYDSKSRLLEHDSIALAIDGDHRGGHGGVDITAPEDWGDFHGQAQLYEAVSRTVTGLPTLNAPDILRQTGVFSWTVSPPYGDGGGGVAGENPTVSVIELYVTPYDFWEGWDSGPEETAFSDLAAGKGIGFAVMVYDWDETTGSWEYFTAIQTDRPYTDMIDLRADAFLDGLLLPANPTDPAEGTAVESVTWGRIKASLR